MWNHLHITPHMENGRIKFGDRYHQQRRRFPQRDVHQISNVDIRADNETRFETDYQRRFDDAEQQRRKNVYYDTEGQPIALDSPDLLPAGIVTSPLLARLPEPDASATLPPPNRPGQPSP